MTEPLSWPDLSNLTATAMLGWYAWHTVSHTIPNLVDAFRAEAAALRSAASDERQSLYDELAAERIQRHTDHLAIVAAFHELSCRLTQLVGHDHHVNSFVSPVHREPS